MPGVNASPSPDELLGAVRIIAAHLRESGKGSELASILSVADEGPSIPLALFAHSTLSSLEITCKYLKENKGLSFRYIGKLLGRNERTIWTTYRNAKRKRRAAFTAVAGESFPVRILRDRKKSVLGAIALHLSATHTTAEIARLLRRPYTTIWATLRKVRRNA